MTKHREINKLEREMQQLVSLMNHTPDTQAKIEYGYKLLDIVPVYQRQLHYWQSQEGNKMRGKGE